MALPGPVPVPGDKVADNPEIQKAAYEAELDVWRLPWRDEVEKELERTKHEWSRELEELKNEWANALEGVKHDWTVGDERQKHLWADLDKRKEVLDARIDTQTAAETASLEAVQGAYLEVAKGSLDRALKRADWVAAAEAAIASLYTGVLGFIYAADKAVLPPRGLVPSFFLGLSLVLAAVYVAFLRRTTTHRRLLPTGLGGTVAEDRLRTFMEWTFTGVLNRAWALRTSIVSLGLGVVLLPMPFVYATSWSTEVVFCLALGVLLGWIAGEWGFAHTHRNQPYSPPVDVPAANTVTSG